MEIAEQRQGKDVQEVEKTELQQQQWRQEEEMEEEVETAVALKERRPRQPSDSTIVVNSTGGITVLFPLSEDPYNGFQKHGREALQDGDKDGNGLAEDSEAISWKNVYYDKDQGTESVDGFSVTENNSLLFSASERSSRDDRLVAAIENFEDQKSQSHAINHQTKEISNDASFSHLGFLPSEKSSERHQTNKSCSDITETLDDEHTVEIDHELTEFDVERVLEKQNTHDLYCPNCNSCITRRVILCKRKRSIWIPEEDKKRNKGQPAGTSQLDASIAPAQNYQGHNTVDNSLDGSLIPEANGHHSGQEPEVFRCFSCFSFFTPAGSGFKLFKKLGDKNDKKKIQSPRPMSEVKKNWFSFLFSSHAATVLVAQGSGHVADVANSSFEVSKEEIKSPHQSFDGQEVLKVTCEPQRGGGDEAEEKPDHVTESGAEGAVLDPADLGTVYELDLSNSPDEIQQDNGSDNPARRLAGKAMERILKPVENATFELNQDGLKILVHSSTDSLTIEKPNMDGKLNEAIKSKPADGTESILLSAKPASVLGESDVSVDILADSENGKNADAGPSTKPVVEYQNAEVKISRNDAANYSGASQHATIGKNMSIHVEEPLKADSNSLVLSIPDDLLLQDRQGTDASIAVQESPVESPAAQGVQDIIPYAKAKPLLHGENSEGRGFHGMDIVKSIVYGGLVESITSLGVVLSAAGADAATLNILALGLANLIGGIFVVGQNLWELKNDHSGNISTGTAENASDQTSKQLDRYQELLGQRGKFSLHATFAILSYLIFGLLPPVIYGFSFRESDNRNFKLIAVAASSLLCIILLATGKAYTQRPPRSYIKTVIYYVVAGFMASGVSYAVGDLIKKLLEKLGWLSSDSALTLTVPLSLQQQAWGGAYKDH